MKPIIVITHERSGTHLLINLINYDKNGEFHTIGFIPQSIPYTLENYKHYTYKDIVVNSYIENIVCKSHHQVEFVLSYLDFLFEKYKVIYLKRDVKDVLVSYYKFIPFPKDLDRFPKFEDWIFSKPDDIGRDFLLPYSPDPHVIIEPENYVNRWKLHIDGWMKYKDNMLVLNYEDILLDFNNQKLIIENYIGKKIGDVIPNVNDKNLPNFNPGKGVVGEYKNWMSQDLIDKINLLV
jgi:hypothetical protein